MEASGEWIFVVEVWRGEGSEGEGRHQKALSRYYSLQERSKRKRWEISVRIAFDAGERQRIEGSILH